MPRAPVAASLVVLAIAIAGCGSDDGESTTAALTPDTVRQNLEDAGYVVGEDITDGANLAVADNGKLDADVYQSVQAGPETTFSDPSTSVGIYYFSSAADAQVLADELQKEDDQFGASEIRDTRVYNISGSQEDLDAVVQAGEGR